MPATGMEGNNHQRADESDEGGALYAACSLGSKDRYGEDRELLRQRQMRIGRLGDEERGHGHVETGPVRVEGKASRHDQSNQGF